MFVAHCELLVHFNPADRINRHTSNAKGCVFIVYQKIDVVASFVMLAKVLRQVCKRKSECKIVDY